MPTVFVIVAGLLMIPAFAQAPTPGTLYLEQCALCHGETGRGPENPDYQGSNLLENAFVKRLTDAELTAFLKRGRAADAPDSTLRALMPPFDYMSDAELKLIVQFLRRLTPGPT